jgi:hypothetical protein
MEPISDRDAAIILAISVSVLIDNLARYRDEYRFSLYSNGLKIDPRVVQILRQKYDLYFEEKYKTRLIKNVPYFMNEKNEKMILINVSRLKKGKNVYSIIVSYTASLLDGESSKFVLLKKNSQFYLKKRIVLSVS